MDYELYCHQCGSEAVGNTTDLMVDQTVDCTKCNTFLSTIADLENRPMGVDETQPKDLSSKLSRQMACEAAHIRKHLSQPVS
ncbi:hypothetical protein [Larsenimonas salina]|uniref:hypothetical protein n=1 Tax=Larsenimonas salina TaxID=1295565 RepID=UPI0020739327|nr:hypothetical protein [Larsenimonas salina]MCM5704250.1 hypothetical protein [Larsenimonas salina]